MRRPSSDELRSGARLLNRLAAEHGLSALRHGAGPGQIVADIAADRSMFDVVEFESTIEGHMGWRPDVVSSSAPGARPGDPINAGDTRAA